MEVYAACVYLRWVVEFEDPGPWINGLGKNRKWQASLLLAKCRVAPLVGLTALRSEMNGLVTGIRLANTALSAMKEIPDNVTCLLNSECCVGAVNSEHGHLTAYLANRRAEVLETLEE